MGGLFSRLIESSDPALMRQALAWLYGFVRPHRGAIGALLALSLGASLLALAQPWLVKTLIDEGLLAKDYQTLWHMAVIMIVAGLLGTVLAGVNRYLHTAVRAHPVRPARRPVPPPATAVADLLWAAAHR